MEYNPSRGQSSTCEIHTEAMTHVKKDDDGAECWKKQEAIDHIFYAPSNTEGYNGKCRTAEGVSKEDGGFGTHTTVPASSVSVCKTLCADRSDCVAIEYTPKTPNPWCEIHTEPITHVFDKGDGAECWKKRAPTTEAPTTGTGT